MTSGSGTTTSPSAGAQLIPGILGLGVQFSSIGTDISTRQKSAALFLFTSPVTLEELKIAATEAVRTGRLPVIFRNRT